MKHINFEECIAQIDESRIEREHDANVYVSACKNCMVIGFAYADKMEDEFTIVRIMSKEKELTLELWQEFLTTAVLIRDKFQVKLIVDDVRFEEGITEKLIKTIESEVVAVA